MLEHSVTSAEEELLISYDNGVTIPYRKSPQKIQPARANRLKVVDNSRRDLHSMEIILENEEKPHNVENDQSSRQHHGANAISLPKTMFSYEGVRGREVALLRALFTEGMLFRMPMNPPKRI